MSSLTHKRKEHEFKHPVQPLTAFSPIKLPETMFVLMIFPPNVARDLGTTVMMLPLVVFTYVAPAGDVAIRALMDGVTEGRVYVAWVPAHTGHTLVM